MCDIMWFLWWSDVLVSIEDKKLNCCIKCRRFGLRCTSKPDKLFILTGILRHSTTQPLQAKTHYVHLTFLQLSKPQLTQPVPHLFCWKAKLLNKNMNWYVYCHKLSPMMMKVVQNKLCLANKTKQIIQDIQTQRDSAASTNNTQQMRGRKQSKRKQETNEKQNKRPWK